MTDDRTARVTGALRQGWHSLGGGDAAACPGCPVCTLTDRVGRLDPAATAHLQAAGTHLLAAGRELLAVLGTRPGDDHVSTTVGGSAPAEAEDPPTAPGRAHPGQPWTTIPVTTRDGDEEQA